MTKACRAWLLSAACLCAANAQVPPKEDPVIAVDVQLVNILCTVRDGKGAFIKGLAKDDFEVLEDGRPREITHFAREADSPLIVALLLDVSGSVSGILTTEKTAARRFFAEVMRPGDQALLAGFAESIGVWQELTRSLATALGALGRIAYLGAEPGTRPGAGTRLHDAVVRVATEKLRGIVGRKTMVLITDGEDNGSFANGAAALKAAQEADVVVYAIHYQDPSSLPWVRRFGAAALKELAEPTGGHMFEIDEKFTLEAAFQVIAEEMRNQYALAFRPAGAARDGAFHRLEVRLKDPALKAQARSGYYAAGK